MYLDNLKDVLASNPNIGSEIITSISVKKYITQTQAGMHGIQLGYNIFIKNVFQLKLKSQKETQ